MVDKVDSNLGNTNNQVAPQKVSIKTSKKKDQCRVWCFTWNNYEVDKVDRVYEGLMDKSIKGIFGLEIGQSGTPHLQGFLRFKNGRTLAGCRNLIEYADKFHWEKAKGDDKSQYVYCSKEQRKVYIWGDWPENIEDKFLLWEPKYWQKDILEMCKKKPEGRKIYWYWDNTGGTGKTTLAKHLVLKYEALYVSGKANDVKCAIATMKVKPRIVIFACPRSGQDYMSYAALEDVSDGLFFNGKYESGAVVMNEPHVLVFANFEPDRSKLSEDRWVVVQCDSF